MQLECIIVGDGERPIRSKTNGPGLENLPGRFVSSSSSLSLSLLRSFDITMKTKGHRRSYQLKKRHGIIGERALFEPDRG